MSDHPASDDSPTRHDAAKPAAPDTSADPHGRDHDEGLAGAERVKDVDDDERFANSRDGGVVDKHNYLDDVGEAVASTLGSVIGEGAAVDDESDARRRDADERPENARK